MGAREEKWRRGEGGGGLKRKYAEANMKNVWFGVLGRSMYQGTRVGWGAQRRAIRTEPWPQYKRVEC